MLLQKTNKELLRWFGKANTHYFDGKLDQIEITIQTRGRKNAVGWASTRKVWEDGNGGRFELNITAEHLKDSPQDIFDTLLHEMVHLSNVQDGIKDCSSGQYHNQRFRDRAEQVGLIVEKGPRGWAYTSLSDEGKAFFESIKPDPDAFSVYRKDGNGTKKAPTKMKKWVCGCTTIRCATQLDAQCVACGTSFVEV